MLPIADLQRKSVAEVKPGTLVLFRYGPAWLRALRVIGPGDDEQERQALIVMPFEMPNGELWPFLFREVGHEKCLVLGQSTAWWSGETSAIVPGRDIDAQPGFLQLRPDGVTLLAATRDQSRSVAAWRIADGTSATIVLEYPLVTEWALGIHDPAGRPRPFVSYPKDFKLAKAT